MANFFKPVNKSKVKNELIKIRIDKLDINGVGIARWNKKPLFISGTIPDETVTVKIVEQKNKFSLGKLISINQESNKRVTPQCQHFGLCGGCDLQMLSLDEQLLFKQQKVEELFSRSFSHSNISQTANYHNLPWKNPILSEPWHYRRKARIGVQFDKKSQATIGFRQKATNQLAAIKSCPVLVEPLSDIFPLLKKLIAKLSVKAAIGHIEVIQADVVNQTSESLPSLIDQRVLIVRQLKPMNQHDINLWQASAEEHNWHVIIDDGKKPHSLFPMSNEQSEVLSYTLADGNNIHFSSSDFIQVNHKVNNAMINQALSWLSLSSDDKVLDLFCGLGNFSLALANKVQSVIGVEGVQAMVDKATHNAQINKLSNCEFYQADLNSEWLSSSWAKTHTFDKVLLDPARAGAEQAVTQLATLKVPTILYVSCDPATLANDSTILLDNGYKIEKISIMDMFSQTKHVESMVLFTL